MGIGLAAAAILVVWGSGRWLETRIFEPVDMAVSMEEGRIQTDAFEINLSEDYRVDVSWDNSSEYRSTCADGKKIGSEWRIYRLAGSKKSKRELWASSTDFPVPGYLYTSFHAVPGKYQLEWDVPAGVVCLNALHPHLSITTSPIEYKRNYVLIQYACVFLGGTGVMLLLRAVWAWLAKELQWERAPRIFPGMDLRNLVAIPRHKPVPLIFMPPNFAFVWGGMIFTLAIAFVIPQGRPSQGLSVNIAERASVANQKNPWAETMSVYLDGQCRFNVNGQVVAREKLGTKLQEELGKRLVWTVYFEGSNDCQYMDAVYAMDTIQGMGAKLVWITPQARKDLNREAMR